MFILRLIDYISIESIISRRMKKFYASSCNQKRITCYILKKRLVFLNRHTCIGNNLFFPHPHNIQIGLGSEIGDNVTIYHNVTIGQKNGCYPHIGNGVIIYPNSVIVGSITIGDNSIIGAGSVVTHNVPDSSVVAGNPAVVISKRKDIPCEKTIKD